jgi:hypothetical protein
MLNERPVIDLKDIIDNKIAKGEPVVIVESVNLDKATKINIDKLNNNIVEQGGKTLVIKTKS